jgi:hypothetical protein
MGRNIKEHLGDNMFVEFDYLDTGTFRISEEGGSEISGEVFLESSVMEKLVCFYNKITKRRRG